MITFADVRIGTGHGLACARCDASEGSATPLPESRIVSRLSAVASAWDSGPGPNVSFTGFEPFLHPALPSIIAAAASSGFERIRLRTDAGALATGGNAAGAYSAGVRHLEIELLGGEELHDRLSNRLGLFAAARTGVSQFMAAAEAGGGRVALSALVRVCKHNVASLSEACVAAAELGCSAVVFDAERIRPTEANVAFVVAALEAATLNRIAGSARGWVGSGAAVDASYTRAPWIEVGE